MAKGARDGAGGAGRGEYAPWLARAPFPCLGAGAAGRGGPGAARGGRVGRPRSVGPPGGTGLGVPVCPLPPL